MVNQRGILYILFSKFHLNSILNYFVNIITINPNKNKKIKCISGIILSVGRIVGESAAILLTAGTVAKMPKGIFSSARTLTVHSYLTANESGDIQTAAAVGIVLIIIVLVLNISTKLITKRLNKAKG